MRTEYIDRNTFAITSKHVAMCGKYNLPATANLSKKQNGSGIMDTGTKSNHYTLTKRIATQIPANAPVLFTQKLLMRLV